VARSANHQLQVAYSDQPPLLVLEVRFLEGTPLSFFKIALAAHSFYFVAHPAGGSLFGAPAPAQGSIFGSAPAPGSSLFGAPAPATGGFGFGSPAAPAPTLFGQPPAPAAQPALPPAGSIIPQAASEVLTYQIQALENKRREMQKLDVWRGKSPDSSSIVPASQPQYDGGVASSAASKMQYSPYRPSPKSTAKIRPRGFVSSPAATSTSPLNNIGTSVRPMMSPDAYAASSVKRLVIKPDSMTPKPKMRLRLTNSPANKDGSAAKLQALPLDATSPLADATANYTAQTPGFVRETPPSPIQSPATTGTATSIPIFGRKDTPTATRPGTIGMNGGKTIASLEKIAPLNDPGLEFYQRVVGSPDGRIPPAAPSRPASASGASSSQPASERKKRPSYLPKLTKAGYNVSPSLDELALKPEADLASLPNFSVHHDKYGRVQWEGAVDVRYADLDSSVFISEGSVEVYTREEEERTKPAVGTKLNRPAVITLFNVFPKNGGVEADQETKIKFAKRIERTSSKMGVEMISYSKDLGEWSFRVDHFSRYGLDDDDESEDDPSEVAPHTQVTPEKEQIEDVDLWQDEELGMDDAAVVSDVEMEKESSLRSAEAAYATIFDTVKTYTDQQHPLEEEDMIMEQLDAELFFEESEEDDGAGLPLRRLLVTKEMYDAAACLHGSAGICSKIAKKAFAGRKHAPSSIDYGIRMGRSFRVGFSKDGSFLQLCPGKGTKLIKKIPVFDDPSLKSGTELLEINERYSCTVSAAIDDGSSRLLLPRSIGNGGSTASHSALHDALAAYAGQGCEVDNLSFSLLSCLVDNEESIIKNEPSISSLSQRTRETQIKARKKNAVARLLVKACETSTKADIQSAVAKGNWHSAILAALCGGDIVRACELCEHFGEEDLSVLLCSFDIDSIGEQVRLCLGSSAKSINDDLLRIYQLLSGDTSVGEDHLDWKRRFLIRLLYGRASSDLSDVLKAYDKDVKSGVAPFPSPQYRGAASGVECILYKILRLSDSPPRISFFDQRGVSPFRHDLTLHFHLASALAAVGVFSLSAWEEEQLLDGYAAQLSSAGHWEWAVYVLLSSLSPDPRVATGWKKNKAKSIILRNFSDDLSYAEEKRRFLRRFVPENWFSEAVAIRNAGGDTFEKIRCLAAISCFPTSTFLMVEKVVVPNLLFMSKEDRQKGLRVLESCQSELTPLSRAILDLFQLAEDVDIASYAPREEILDELPDLVEVCKTIENTLVAARSKVAKEEAPLTCRPSLQSVPMKFSLCEAAEECAFLRLQLSALEKGIDITSATSKKKLASQLAFYAVDKSMVQDSQASDVLLRGLR